jgi:hypothetical protein
MYLFLLRNRAEVPPNTALEQTPHCGQDAAPILRTGISPTALSTNQGGAAQRQAVGPQPHGEEIVWPGRGYLLT